MTVAFDRNNWKPENDENWKGIKTTVGERNWISERHIHGFLQAKFMPWLPDKILPRIYSFEMQSFTDFALGNNRLLFAISYVFLLSLYQEEAEK